MVPDLHFCIRPRSQPVTARAHFEGNPLSDYTGEDITVLEGLEAVRKRPGMYIGSTGITGLHHLVKEVVDNSVDEAMAGNATRIEVTLLKSGGVRNFDNGRGVPVDVMPKYGKPAA